jgi:hypothetical protein
VEHFNIFSNFTDMAADWRTEKSWLDPSREKRFLSSSTEYVKPQIPRVSKLLSLHEFEPFLLSIP